MDTRIGCIHFAFEDFDNSRTGEHNSLRRVNRLPQSIPACSKTRFISNRVPTGHRTTVSGSTRKRSDRGFEFICSGFNLRTRCRVFYPHDQMANRSSAAQAFAMTDLECCGSMATSIAAVRRNVNANSESIRRKSIRVFCARSLRESCGIVATLKSVNRDVKPVDHKRFSNLSARESRESLHEIWIVLAARQILP